MTRKDFSKIKKLMLEFDKIKTWKKSKHDILKNVLRIMELGPHEYFKSDYRIHGEYVGYYYLESKNHKRRGTLEKYRGKKIMILCYKRGSLSIRYYIVAVIED